MHRVYAMKSYQVIQLYKIVRMYDYHYQKKINCTEEVFSKEDIIVTQKKLNCMFERTLYRSAKHAWNRNC